MIVEIHIYLYFFSQIWLVTITMFKLITFTILLILVLAQVHITFNNTVLEQHEKMFVLLTTDHQMGNICVSNNHYMLNTENNEIS